MRTYRMVNRPKGDPLLRYDVDANGCWIWQGATVGNGYGHLAVDNKFWPAHRYYYTQLRGEVPVGLDLDHLCRVRRCVNPDHLEPVTRGENLRRGYQARTR